MLLLLGQQFRMVRPQFLDERPDREPGRAERLFDDRHQRSELAPPSRRPDVNVLRTDGIEARTNPFDGTFVHQADQARVDDIAVSAHGGLDFHAPFGLFVFPQILENLCLPADRAPEGIDHWAGAGSFLRFGLPRPGRGARNIK